MGGWHSRTAYCFGISCVREYLHINDNSLLFGYFHDLVFSQFGSLDLVDRSIHARESWDHSYFLPFGRRLVFTSQRVTGQAFCLARRGEHKTYEQQQQRVFQYSQITSMRKPILNSIKLKSVVKAEFEAMLREHTWETIATDLNLITRFQPVL